MNWSLENGGLGSGNNIKGLSRIAAAVPAVDFVTVTGTVIALEVEAGIVTANALGPCDFHDSGGNDP